MSKHEKLLSRARNNPQNLTFDEFQTLLKRAGWLLDHQTGSHQIWYSEESNRLSIQNKNGKAKSYQVKQFLTLFDEENKNV